MAINKVFIKTRFLNYLISSGMLFANTINVHRISAATQENIDIPKVVSYRSASCGCCKKWINHLRDNGFEVVDNIVENVSVIKNQYQIPNNLRSCHSAQIAKYTIEGHVPIESINKLFREKPDINGILDTSKLKSIEEFKPLLMMVPLKKRHMHQFQRN